MKDIKKQTFLAIRLNKPISYLIKTVTFLIFFHSTSISAQDLRDLSHTLKFADYLFMSKQFVLASEEYERAVYYDSTSNHAKLRLLQSYRFANNHKLETERFKSLFKDSLQAINSTFAEEYLKNLILLEKYKEAYSFADKSSSLNTSKKETYQLGSLLLQKQWDNSFNYALKHPVTGDKKNADLHVIAFGSKQVRYKKPFVAATLSTIVPGTGKMYAKSWKDGLISLVFVGVNAWQAYRGFNKYGIDSAYGWIFAGISGSFYIGNIFGSAKAAKKYNKKLDDEIYHNAWHIMVDDM